MATTTRRKLPDLIEEIFDNAASFEFYQVLRLLESGWHGHGQVGKGLDKWLRMRPAPEISFPAADIRRCSFDDNGQVDLELNFMGLYGVDAPVPYYFTEYIARDDDSSAAMRAFLDIFSQRIYSLFYQAWKKYRPYVDLEMPDSPYLDYVIALSGQSLNGADHQELGFSGSMGSRVRNGTSLAGMLSEYMGEIPARVDEFVPRWVQVDTEAVVGGEGHRAMKLGDNTILGNEVLDISGKIDICIGPMDVSEVKDLLPGRPQSIELGHFIQRYLDPTLDFDLVLVVKPSSMLGMQLGSDDVMLGWSTWVGYQMKEIDEIRIPGSTLLAPAEKIATELENKSETGLALVA